MNSVRGAGQKKKKKRCQRQMLRTQTHKPNEALIGDLLRENCLGYICYCSGLGFDVMKIVLYGTLVISIH